jgi:signal transduction histidine kinase
VLPRLKFRHRIGLLVSLAAAGLILVTAVTLVLGRRSKRAIDGIETRYVPLIELDRDLKRTAADLMKAVEDAAGAAEETKLAEADRLSADFERRLGEGRQAILGNGGDPDAVLAALHRYYTTARGVASSIIHGTAIAQLTDQIDAMHRAQVAFLGDLSSATSPDRKRLSDAFEAARATHREVLIVDIVVAAAILAMMGLVSWSMIRRMVRSLQAVSDGVERLAGGDLATPIDVPPGDEIADLAREANRTATRLREYREQAAREEQRALSALVETRRQAQATEVANRELEAFSYSVSHDLRGPLRAIDGFSQALIEDEQLSPTGINHLTRVRGAAQRMSELIDDLLRLSRVSRGSLTKNPVDLSAIVDGVLADLRKANPDRSVTATVQPGVTAVADARLIKITFENLLGNAWKFTTKISEPRIEFGTREDPARGTVFFVRDNGAGFDMAYSDRLFGAFQRLHTDREFPGTGIGLATVQRIVRRHGGDIWAESAVGAGATFHFTLPAEPEA